jgi:hypothetical protein
MRTAPPVETWYWIACRPASQTALPEAEMLVKIAFAPLPASSRSPMRPPHPVTAPSGASACQIDCWSLCENSLAGLGNDGFR